MPNLNRKKIILSALLPTLLYMNANASDSDVSLEAVKVVSAAGYSQKVVEAPASITVISKEQLEERSFTNLLDAVRETEGVDIGESRDKTGQGTVSIRGMGGDYTLFLIDGKRQNNVGDIYPNNFGGSQQSNIPPLEMIERVEIIRGPMATLYGADAIGGLINIITKKVSNEWVATATVSQTLQTDDNYGNDNTIDIAVMGPIIKDKLGIALRASKYDKEASNPEYADAIDPDGNLVPRELGFGGGGRTVQNDNYSLGARLAYTPHPKHEIVLDIDTYNQQFDNSDSQLGTADSLARLPRAGYAEEQEFKRSEVSLSYEADWDIVKSKITAYQVNSENLGRTLPLTAAERIDYDNNITDGLLPRPPRTLETRQLTVDGKFDISLEEHMIVLGFQYIDAEMEDGVFGMTGTSGYTDGVVQAQKQWALFAEENWFVTEGLTLTVGARYDESDIFGSNVSPRAYAVYTFANDFTIKGGVGTGYKTPQASDLYDGIVGFGGQGTSPFVGNPDLTPETSVNTEIAFYYENRRNDTFNITYFHNEFKDKIQSGPDASKDIGADWASLGYTEFSTMLNIDSAVIQGIEIAGKYNINEHFIVSANYTYLDSEQKSGPEEGLPLSESPEQMYNLKGEYRANQDLSMYAILTGETGRYGGIPRGGTVDDAFYYKDYSVVNAGISYKANENVTLHGRINNVLDQDFTSYTTQFIGVPGNWDTNYQDDYNTKTKAREFWLSMNVKI